VNVVCHDFNHHAVLVGGRDMMPYDCGKCLKTKA